MLGEVDITFFPQKTEIVILTFIAEFNWTKIYLSTAFVDSEQTTS